MCLRKLGNNSAHVRVKVKESELKCQLYHRQKTGSHFLPEKNKDVTFLIYSEGSISLQKKSRHFVLSCEGKKIYQIPKCQNSLCIHVAYYEKLFTLDFCLFLIWLHSICWIYTFSNLHLIFCLQR